MSKLYTDEIEWDKDTFDGFDWVDDYTEEGNIKGTSKIRGVMVEYTAIASRNGERIEIQEETIDVENMTPITKEEEL